MDKVDILALVNVLRPGPFSSRLARKPATSVADLHKIMEKYYRVDANFRMKFKAQRAHAYH